ncbi:hypothetical protein HNY73_002682 [Argiope bruennichi]|uniref:Uncharacterized protein n=1 Tax=Argiope bruennichi TaxID=94029 RepID=A0A8T0FYM2_ARGBR|nr:hypothetical protein HNY73_002682 [Argiope bruennichi]
MANRRNLSHADIGKLIEASDNEEEVSEYENHTSDEIESESSDNNFDTDIHQMNHVESILSKNREKIGIRFRLPPILLNQQLLIFKKTTQGVTRYATARISDIKSAFEVVFNSTIENGIIYVYD